MKTNLINAQDYLNQQFIHTLDQFFSVLVFFSGKWQNTPTFDIFILLTIINELKLCLYQVYWQFDRCHNFMIIKDNEIKIQ